MKILILTREINYKMRIKIKILMTRALQIKIVHFRRKKLLRLKLIQLKRNLLEIIKIFAENYERPMVYQAIGENFARKKRFLWKMFYKKMRKIGYKNVLIE